MHLGLQVTAHDAEDDSPSPDEGFAAARQAARSLVTTVKDGDREAAARLAPRATVRQLFAMRSEGVRSMRVTTCHDRSDPERLEDLGEAAYGCEIRTRFTSDDGTLDLLQLDETDGEWRAGELVGISST